MAPSRGRPGLGPPPDARALLAAARQHGTVAGRSGAIDQWMFGDDLLLPYLAELRWGRAQAISETRGRAADLEGWDQAELRLTRSRGAGLRRRQTFLEREHATALTHMNSAWARINWLARRDALREPAPDLTDPGGDSPGEPDDQGANQPTQQDLLGAWMTSGPTADPRWEGPHAPRMNGWWTAAILGGLVGVEVPIQYVIFRYFQGYSATSKLLTWAFTIPVSAVMVLLPHLSGWLYRGRRATGSDKMINWASLVLLAPWVYLAGMLGYLRARVLLAKPSLPISASTTFLKHLPNNAATLHVTAVTASILFVALILGVGGIGFLLGVAREHPLAGGYSGADAEQRRIARQLEDLEPAAALASERAAASAADADRSGRQADHRIEAINATYAAAEQAYLDALVRAAADPAVTEAVARLSAATTAGPAQPQHAQARPGP